MDLDKWRKVFEIISIAIAAIATVYKVLFKNNEDKSKQYFEKILLGFVNAHYIDNNMDCIEYIRNRISKKNEYIPTYLHYLVDNNDNSKLKKVLLFDYCRFYKNDDSELNKMLRVTEKIMHFILLFLYAGSIILLMFECLGGLIFFIFHTKSLVSETVSVFGLNFPRIAWYLIFFIGIIIVIIVYALIISLFQSFHEDDYTLKTKNIEKLIEKKVKYYDKNHKKFYKL